MWREYTIYEETAMRNWHRAKNKELQSTIVITDDPKSHFELRTTNR